MFHVGQKVVCLVEFGLAHHERGPVKGETYTIRGIEACDAGSGDLFFYLVEIVNQPETYCGGVFGEANFHSNGFRPVVNTDISIFTAMLKTTRQGADA